MDTIDSFSPAFHNPQRIADVARMLSLRRCEVTFEGIASYQGGCAAVLALIKRVN